MRVTSRSALLALLAANCLMLAACATGTQRAGDARSFDDLLAAPVAMPPGFGRTLTDMGLVFTDPDGMTLYLYGGNEGACLASQRNPPPNMHPLLQIYAKYPAPVCTEQWQPVRAAPGAIPIGDWTIVQRPEGGTQWAYKGKPVHRSFRDRLPGDAHGTSGRGLGHVLDFQLALAPMNLPPGVSAKYQGGIGLIAVSRDAALYVFENDGAAPQLLTGDGASEARWSLLPAATTASNVGPWKAVDMPGHSKAWIFDGKPVYTFSRDQEASDVAGLAADEQARLLVLKPVSKAPPGITVRRTLLGPAYADSRGMTLYSFSCMHRVPGEQTPEHNYFCDDYRSDVLHREQFCIAADRCADVFAPLRAPSDAQPRGGSWSVAMIPDQRYPMRWKPLARGEVLPSGAVKVWTYRGRPVYTSLSDTMPGQLFGYRDLLTGAFMLVVLAGEWAFSG